MNLEKHLELILEKEEINREMVNESIHRLPEAV